MNQVPAHILARQKRDLVGAATGGINAGAPAHISIADNRFTMVDDAGNKKIVPTHHVDLCIIDANASVSRVYFDPRKPFIPGGDNNDPPICWSDNGIGASAQASQPQNVSCQLCPHAAWNSAVSKQTGKGVPACSSVKKIAVVVPGVDMVFSFRVPPASLKGWLKYCQTLSGHGVDLPDALTRVEFESQGVLKFTPVGYIDAETAALSDRAMEAKITDALIGRNDRPWTGQGEAGKVAYAQQQAAPQIAPSPPAPTPMAPPPQPFGGQQAAPTPFGAAGVVSPQTSQATPFGNHGPAPTAPTTSPSDPFGGQPGTASPPAAIPAKRTRGPNKKAETAPADDGIPPFLQRNPPPADPAPVNPTQFGMQATPAAPDAGIAAALDAAFRLPT